MTEMRMRLAAMVAVCVLGMITDLAWAEEPQQDGTGWLIEEITVTARKREESLQDTPISISAYTAESLEYRGVTQLSEIADFTPNLVFQNNASFGGASNAAAVYIRGIGQKEFLPTVEPGVGIYVDGVYIARSVGAILDIVDVERVEVLRGPQGTLFGRNTIGGAINITTKKPNEELSGQVELTGGSDERADGQVSFNLPITDRFFSKITLASFNRDGYLERLDDGKELGNNNSDAGRLALRWLATDNLEFNFSLDGTRAREHGPALRLLGITYDVGLSGINFPLVHNMMRAPACYPPDSGDPNNPDCYNTQYMASDRKDKGTGPSYSDTDIWGTNLTVDWDLGAVAIKSITAYRNLDSEFARDGDHSPLVLVHFKDSLEQDQFSQELQVSGVAIDDRLNWIVGAYYFEESGDNVNTLDFTPAYFRSGGKFDNESWAVFGQGTFNITTQLSFTLGVRYTDETKKFKPDQIIYEDHLGAWGDGTRILPYRQEKLSDDETTPLANIAYRWNDDLMTYVSYSKGFKGGGFVQRVFPPLPPDIPKLPSFKPETVDAYEVGFKLTGLDQRLRFNGAAFLMDYDDLQIQTFTGVAPITKNAASAEIKGFELELSAAPGDGWFIEGGIGYLDPEYKKIDFAETGVDKDNKFDRVSDWTLSAAVSKEFEIGKCGRLTPRVDWAYRTAFYNDAFNTEQIAQDDYYNVVNANLTWDLPNINAAAVIGVTNLTDEEYLITGIFGDAFGQYEGLYARGREYYATLRYAF